MQTLDPDTRAVMAFLRDALAASGMSQRAFARALNTLSRRRGKTAGAVTALIASTGEPSIQRTSISWPTCV